MTTSQLVAFSETQYAALSSDQHTAFSVEQVKYLTLGTPIILDLNGDGVKTLSISSGVKFDLFAEGQSINTGWVSSGDGLLVLDRNGDGVINNGTELFGSSTQLANGQKAPDGYAALRELDSNGDGIISADDALFAELRVWVDSNSDGINESGEVKTLASLGITSINARAAVNLSTDNGNLIGLTSSYETADGATHAAADVWFVADKSSATSLSTDAASLDQAIAALGTSSAAFVETPLDADVQLAEVPVFAPNPTIAAVATAEADLRTRVSSMAQAMSSFNAAGTTDNTASDLHLDATAGGLPANSAVSLAVVSMVDVMKQFDSNGGLIGNQATTTATLGKSLNQSGILDPANNTILAIGGIK